MINWLDKLTDDIIKSNSDKKFLTCQCGLSTTGVAHIGNFREPIISYLVSEALKIKGYDNRIVLSFDDFDRLKKVPKGIDQEYQKYIGMPNYSFKSPFDDKKGYAQYFEDKVIEQLNKLGISMDYIKQSERYLSKEYNDYIRLVLKQKNDIFDIIKKYKTQELTEDDKKCFYPVKVYCSHCNKDSTIIKSYDEATDEIYYKCECGHKEKNTIDNLKVKMKFNVEWPMRWNLESVDFEPCGRGHAEINGALPIALEINSKIYNSKSPKIISYGFLNLKGNEGRMNKNSSEIITVDDILEIMPREMLLYYFYIQDPKKEISISLIDDIPKLYKKFEDFLYNEKDERVKRLLKIDYNNELTFNDLVKYLPAANFDVKKLKEYISFKDSKHNLIKIKCVSNWLNKYYDNKFWIINKRINIDYWNSLPEEEKKCIICFGKLLKEYDSFSSYDEFFDKFKESGNNMNNFFKNFYKLVFNTERGLPVKTILKNYDIKQICELLNLPLKIDSHSSNNTKIIHLSDLHFDINDNNNELFNKWDKMIYTLKQDVKNDDVYLALSGDIICFYHLEKDFELALDYLNYLVDELKITKDKIFVCTGNHEMNAYNTEVFDKDFFDKFDDNIKNKLRHYSEFLKKLNNRSIDSIEDLYYLQKFEKFNILIINSLFQIINDTQLFLQDEKHIDKVISKFDDSFDKFNFVLSHAPYQYNQSLFDKTLIADKFNYNLCGHKHNQLSVKSDKIVDLVSGNSDGFVEEVNKYNIYSLGNKLETKKLIYKKDNWGLY